MKLFEPFKLGNIGLQNRVVMAPMTRSRAVDNVAGPLMAEYYGQRGTAGLVITEGTSPSINGLGYARIPGMFTLQQSSSWQQVADAVHCKGGRIFMQLMHCGRVVNKLNLPKGGVLLAPSAVTMSGVIWTDSQGEQPYDAPREMTKADIGEAVASYVNATRLAIAAGIDGIEIHGANGYLVNQFLDPGSNLRTDDYGGSADRRNRFAREVAAAVATEAGAGRVGIRLSPYGVFNDMSGAYEGIAQQYDELAAAMGKLKLAYLHMVDHSAMGAPKPDAKTVSSMCSSFREAGGQSIILSGGYDFDRAEADITSGAADLIAYGRPFISNPDLVYKLKTGKPLTPPDQTTFYTPGSKGYTDYF